MASAIGLFHICSEMEKKWSFKFCVACVTYLGNFITISQPIFQTHNCIQMEKI